MIRNAKVNYYIICAFFVLCSSSLLFANDQNTFNDYISKKTDKEPKAEIDRNVKMALAFSNVQGRKLSNVVNLDYIEKIHIPYQTNINPAQISYLFQNAVFKKYNELAPWHLAPIGTFHVILKNYSVLEFHMYASAPMVRVTVKTDEYWLEIPHHEAFYALGKEKEAKK
ncbi:MAG: hypothetical protein ACYDGO_10105 [Smithellaceae bacterium]